LPLGRRAAVFNHARSGSDGDPLEAKRRKGMSRGINSDENPSESDRFHSSGSSLQPKPEDQVAKGCLSAKVKMIFTKT